MPLHVAEPPAASVDALRSALGGLAERGQFRTRRMSGAQLEQLALTVPHPVYVVGLNDVASGRGLDSATLVNWRYLIQEADRVIAGAETDATSHSLSQINEGPFVRSTAEALTKLEEREEVREGSYELRLLKIPALYVIALWLRDERGGTDLLQPLSPAPADLSEERLYREGEFFELLRPTARALLEFDSSPRSS